MSQPVLPAAPPVWRAYAALGVGVLALSMTSIFVRLSSAPGPVTAFYRMLVAALLLAVPALLALQRQTSSLPAVPLRLAVAAGALAGLDHALLSASVALTRIANLTLLNNIAPLWVALAAFFFFRERLPRQFWLGLAFTLGGAGFVIGYDLLAHPHLSGGDALAGLSSLFYAAYYLVTQRARRALPVLVFMWIVNLGAAGVLLLVCLSAGYPLSGFDSRTWLVFLASGLFSQGIGYLAVAYALGRLPASAVAPTMVAQPVLTTLLAVPLTGEGLNWVQWLGGAVVLTGIYLVNRRALPVLE